ncbi:MAG: glycosyltransferase family 1 protein [Candidatus Ratteibacteria bacterium]
MEQKRILFDIRPLKERELTGIGWYTYHLLHALANIDRNNSYILYDFFLPSHTKYCRELSRKIPIAENFTLSCSRFPGKIMRRLQQCGISLERFFGPFDIVHLPHCWPVYTKKGRYIVTIHDLTPIIEPAWHPYARGRTFRTYAPKVSKTADHIITDSENTKYDIMRYLSVPEEKISAIPLGADSSYMPLTTITAADATLDRHDISKPYILFVGTIEPRKNVSRLLQAFEMMRAKTKEKVQLVIAGKKGWDWEKTFEIFTRLSPSTKENIKWLEYVPSEDLPLLYGAATIFVYPSLYEGFGLPVLEAMSCGVPVITSNISSLPEVAGNGAILVHPYDISELAKKMEEMLCDVDLNHHYREQSLTQAKKFSWHKTAKKTFALYTALLQN